MDTEVSSSSSSSVTAPESDISGSSVSGSIVSRSKYINIYSKNGNVLARNVNASDTQKIVEVFRNNRNAVPIKLNLFKFQEEFLERARSILSSSQFLINSSDTGTGKTITSIALLIEFNVPAIVICPTNVKTMWESQFLIYGIKQYKLFTYDEFRGRLTKGKTESEEYIMDNMVERTIIKGKSRNTVKINILPEFDDWFNKYGGSGLIIFDEFHKIKNEKTATTVVARSLINYCLSAQDSTIRLLLLSATPFDKIENFETFFRNVGFLTKTRVEGMKEVLDNESTLLENLGAYDDVDDLAESFKKYSRSYSVDDKQIFMIEAYKTLRKNTGVLISVDDILKTDPSAFNGNKVYKRNGYFKLPADIIEGVRSQMNILYDLNNMVKVEGIEKIQVIAGVIRSIEKLETMLFARLAFDKINRRNHKGQFDKVIVSLESRENVQKVKRLVDDMVNMNEIEKLASDYLNQSNEKKKEKILDTINIKTQYLIDNNNISIAEIELIRYYSKNSIDDEYKDLDYLKDKYKEEGNLGMYKPICDEIMDFIESDTYSEQKALSLIKRVMVNNNITELVFLSICLEHCGSLTEQNMRRFKELATSINFEDRPSEINIVTVSGETSNVKKSMNATSERDYIFSRFNKEVDVKLLVMTTNVGGVGISLHNTVTKDEDRYMFISLSYNTISVSQTSGRAFRVGVMGDCYVYTVNGCEEGTAQKNIISALKDKGSNLDIAIGEGQREDASPSKWPDYCENDNGEMVPASEVADCDANSGLEYLSKKELDRKRREERLQKGKEEDIKRGSASSGRKTITVKSGRKTEEIVEVVETKETYAPKPKPRPRSIF